MSGEAEMWGTSGSVDAPKAPDQMQAQGGIKGKPVPVNLGILSTRIT